MKILLVAVNSKYIHSNPAVYLLRAYTMEHLDRSLFSDFKNTIEIAEYTINQQTEDILDDIYHRSPDVIAFACYIWNIRTISELLHDLAKILPDKPIFLGGPEVSYDAQDVLNRFPNVTGVIVGEGEATFSDVVRFYFSEDYSIQSNDVRTKNSQYRYLPNAFFTIPGLCLPDAPHSCVFTGSRASLSMDDVPFFYQEWAADPDLGPFKNKILYYETSRGCPFRCSYCLSSVDKHLRLRSLNKVFDELQFFLDHNVHQVKFIDRTFNCNEDHALAIWKYIAAHDNGITNFHFEISADILTDAELDVLKTMRPGLVQLEIGVQSTNPDTIREIRRTMDLEKLRTKVAAIHSFRNIHQHLDLIAGLPYENYESFTKSFNDLYEMQPDQLQLGFLKVLKGAYMAEQVDEYDLKYTGEPPYEVLSTKWITYSEIRHLKKIESMVELYYNSLQFTKTLSVLVPQFESPFVFFDILAGYYEENGYFINQPARVYRYQVLLNFAKEHTSLPEELISELLTYDLYLRENAKSRPVFSKDLTPFKEEIYKRETDRRNHIDVFRYPIWKDSPDDICERSDKPYYLEFNYGQTDPLSKNATVQIF